ncbi:MAG: hypothetical protein RJA25_1755 [Bacteroidota bacterium]|jgi:uncharacterized membrane protein
MTTSRLEAFSDGVLAIIITIMVLGIKIPEGSDWIDLKPLIPNAIGYILSFIYVGIYWNNHHHLMQMTKGVNGKILWANLHLLFWLSLLPLATEWMGENKFEGNTIILYGIILLMSAIAWQILATQLVKHKKNTVLKKVLEKDKKTLLSIIIYAAGVVLGFIYPFAALAFYYGVAILWIIPDIRLEELNELPE